MQKRLETLSENQRKFAEFVMFLISITIFWFLWNQLIPDIFGLSTISWKQSLGIKILWNTLNYSVVKDSE
jgi:hypothetical protein